MNLFSQSIDRSDYQPRRCDFFEPERIVLTRGWNSSDFSRQLVERIIALYANIQVDRQDNFSHAKVSYETVSNFNAHLQGKKTLVFGEHQSAVRLSDESGNSCPNYWHFSVYGFCPYGCTYCYLAGTPGVKFSPSVKIFVNIESILQTMAKTAKSFDKPTTFYHGKLQDGLALDSLTGYSRVLVPFFASQKYARQILLTKSADVANLFDLEHCGKTILSWTLSPESIATEFEPNTPSIAERIVAMKQCAATGYPIRAVLMPIIPVENWLDIYTEFLTGLLQEVDLDRLTIGAICSYSGAISLMNQKLGQNNPITRQMNSKSEADGRVRYPQSLRLMAYRHLIATAKKIRPDLDIGLCLETTATFEELNRSQFIGKCNCIW